jgi:hypothetical protein
MAILDFITLINFYKNFKILNLKFPKKKDNIHLILLLSP